ncbi:MAG: ParA family protein [Bacteroides cellulosilyticus]|nr:ParA family protein [Bacteroides cellulosilyticus]
MEHNQSCIAVCNQKGGIGKSTFTTLLASHLHYTLRHNVLVVDCDYPQWSIHAHRERELAAVEQNDYYKLMMVRQFRQTGRKVWPIVRCMPADAGREVDRFLSSSDYRPAIILYDLPGTVNTEGIIGILSTLDRLFVPMKADKVVMESTLSFARTLHLTLVQNRAVRLAGMHLFWTMIDRRERTPLYGQYEEVICKLGLPLMRTHVPYRSKFNKELLADSTGVGRSTLLAPERSFAADAQIDALASEILSILNIRDNG